MSRLLAALSVLLLGTACAQTVRPLGLHDDRLPPDARRWVADAEDAVVVAEASREEAAGELASVLTWRARVTTMAFSEGPGSVEAAQALERMAESRALVSRLELSRAEAGLALATAKRVQVNAETAIRHDIAVYDLEPVRKATDAARAEVETQVRALEAARRTCDEATTAWWQAFQAHVSAGGKGEALWVAP